MNTSEWLRAYFRDLFMSDATDGLYTWDEDGESLESYIDTATGAYVMNLCDDDGNLYELRITPL